MWPWTRRRMEREIDSVTFKFLSQFAPWRSTLATSSGWHGWIAISNQLIWAYFIIFQLQSVLQLDHEQLFSPFIICNYIMAFMGGQTSSAGLKLAVDFWLGLRELHGANTRRIFCKTISIREHYLPYIVQPHPGMNWYIYNTVLWLNNPDGQMMGKLDAFNVISYHVPTLGNPYLRYLRQVVLVFWGRMLVST